MILILRFVYYISYFIDLSTNLPPWSFQTLKGDDKNIKESKKKKAKKDKWHVDTLGEKYQINVFVHLPWALQLASF